MPKRRRTGPAKEVKQVASNTLINFIARTTLFYIKTHTKFILAHFIVALNNN